MRIIIMFLGLSAAAQAAVLVEGGLDVRPSWTTASGTLHTENEVELGARWSERAALSYVQEFRTNLSGTAAGLAARAKDGYLKGNFALSGPFSFEPRLILPTDSRERQATMKLSVRPILKAIWSSDNGPGLEIWESPVVPWYGAAGVDVEGTPVANRAFENRIEVIPTWNFAEGTVALRLPIVWQLMKRRSFHPDAANDGGWHSYVWLNPEIVVYIGEKTGLGLAYYSETFTGEGASVSEGFRQGVFQAVFQQAL